MRKLLVLMLGVFWINLGYSQITITSTNMPLTGDTLRYSSINMTTLGDYTSTGAGYLWDFSTVNPQSQDIRKFVSPLSAGYFFGISSSAYGEKVADSLNLFIVTFTDVYDFFKKNSTTSYNGEALGMKYSGIGIPNTYTDRDEIYQFPLNYNDRDSSTFRMSTISYSAIPFRYVKQGYRITQADGWGFVTTPYGTEQCLRVVTTQYSIDSIVGTIPGIPIPLAFGLPNYARSYQWLTLTERIPYFEVKGTMLGTIFTPTEARFRDNVRSFVGVNENKDNTIALSAYPNPVDKELNFSLPEAKDYQLEIYSMSGQLLVKKTLDNKAMEAKHSIDVSALGQSIYWVKVIDGKRVQNFKFIKQ
jgi:hypothetical protein